MTPENDSGLVSARQSYAKLNANTSGPHHQGQTSAEAQAALDEIDRLRRQVATEFERGKAYERQRVSDQRQMRSPRW